MKKLKKKEIPERKGKEKGSRGRGAGVVGSTKKGKNKLRAEKKKFTDKNPQCRGSPDKWQSQDI